MGRLIEEISQVRRVPERILVIRLSSLGDVVLASTAIDALKENFPGSDVFLLVKSEYVELYEDDPRLTGVVSLDTSQPGGIRRLISDLRKRDFDVVVDLQKNLRSLLISSLIGAKRRIRYRKRRLQRMAMVHAKWLPVRPRPTVDLYLDCLKRLGIKGGDREPKLFVNSEARFSVQGFLSESGVAPGEAVVGINPGARWEVKRWTAEGFAKVSDRLLERPGVKVVFLGDDPDLNFVDGILSRMASGPIVATGKLDLKELVALIEGCHVLLTNDSGPMHIASALGVPVVAIFGPTHPKLGFGPRGEKNVVVSANSPCSPCSLHGSKACKRQRRDCMEDISAEMVMKKVERLLEDVSVRVRRPPIAIS